MLILKAAIPPATTSHLIHGSPNSDNSLSNQDQIVAVISKIIQQFKIILQLSLIFWLYFVLTPNIASAQITAPTNLTGLVLWVDANDVAGTGIQPANNTLVGTWADKSGNSNNLTAAAGLRPTFESTSFDSVRPGMRFFNGVINTFADKMSGPNLFGVANQPNLTMFVVMSNATLTSNFALNLNGDNSGSAATDRFSLHLPWSDETIYYDAAGCCGTTRLTTPFTDSVTTTTLITAQNSVTNSNQLLRRNGLPASSDNSAITARVSDGIRIGATSGHSFDGRFAEIVIYNRALTLTEIGDVECYLLKKWKPSALPANCTNMTVGVISQGGTDSFTFTGTNGWTSQTITTTIAGATTTGTTQTLTAASTSTTITQSAPPAGFTLTAINCSGLGSGGTATNNIGTRTVTLNAAATAAGSNITCIFTNTKHPILTLVKTVTNDNGRTALATAWTLTATGPTTISGATASAAVTNATVSAGSYTLSESGPTNYTAGNWGCSSGSLTGSVLVLANGQTATCTINNNDNPMTVNISILKNDSMLTYTPNSTSSYVLTVNNTGPDTASGVSINDNLPAGITLTGLWNCVASSGSSCGNANGGSAGGSSVALAGTIASGGTLTITLPVKFSASASQY